MSADREGSAPTPAALQAQLLATEHWSLLASRSTTQSEVLSRITIFLTLVSAGLVTIGVLGQATAFSGAFLPATIGILLFVLVVGLITQVRVFNVADEDLMYVLAMNRMRAAYVRLAPEIETAFLASAHDDERGVEQTYEFSRPRRRTHVLGSSMVLMALVVGVIAGLLVGLLVATALVVPVGVAVGAVVGAGWLVVSMLLGYRMYRRSIDSYPPLRPHGD